MQPVLLLAPAAVPAEHLLVLVPATRSTRDALVTIANLQEISRKDVLRFETTSGPGEKHSRALLPMNVLFKRIEVQEGQDLAAGAVGPERRYYLLLDGTGVPVKSNRR